MMTLCFLADLQCASLKLGIYFDFNPKPLDILKIIIELNGTSDLIGQAVTIKPIRTKVSYHSFIL